MPARTELDANALLEVYGYPRNLQEMYLVGKVGQGLSCTAVQLLMAVYCLIRCKQYPEIIRFRQSRQS